MTESSEETLGQLGEKLGRVGGAIDSDAQLARYALFASQARLGLGDDAPVSALPPETLAKIRAPLGGAAASTPPAELAHENAAALLQAVGLDDQGSPRDGDRFGSLFAPGSRAAASSPALAAARAVARKASETLTALEAERVELMVNSQVPPGERNARWALLWEQADAVGKTLTNELMAAHARVRQVAEGYAKQAASAKVAMPDHEAREIRDRLAAMPADQRSALLGRTRHSCHDMQSSAQVIGA